MRVESLVDQLRVLLVSKLNHDPEISELATRAFHFGELVEQVLYHPTIEDFMYREEDAPQQDVRADPTDFIGNYSPQPGEIKVGDSWFQNLKQRWGEFDLQTELNIDDLAKRFQSGKGGGAELLSRIDDAFKVHAGAEELYYTIKIELRRDTDDAVVHSAGKQCVVPLDTGLFIKELLEANGRWVAMKDLEGKHPELRGKKPGRLKSVLPRHFRELIDSSTKLGTRLAKP